MEKNFYVVGVTGNSGTGKTTVCRFIEQLGFPVIYTDILAKEVMENDLNVKEKIIQTFGQDSYFPNGKINSQYLANLVFNSDSQSNELLSSLDSIVHPIVIDKLVKIIEQLGQTNKIIFVESALIFEVGLEDGFDYVILVESNLNSVVHRLKEKRISREGVVKRWKKQLPQKQKRELADFTIVNNGTYEDLEKSTKFILELIKNLTEISE